MDLHALCPTVLLPNNIRYWTPAFILLCVTGLYLRSSDMLG